MINKSLSLIDLIENAHSIGNCSQCGHPYSEDTELSEDGLYCDRCDEYTDPEVDE